MAISKAFVHEDFDFVQIEVVRDSIWYSDSVGTFCRMGAVQKQLLPQRARILRRTPVKLLTSIAHNLTMSTKRKAYLPQTDHHSSRKGRSKKQKFSINDVVKLVSDFLNNGQSMPSLSEFFNPCAILLQCFEFCCLLKICTDKFFAGD
jgi:hypothetical protein